MIMIIGSGVLYGGGEEFDKNAAAQFVLCGLASIVANSSNRSVHLDEGSLRTYHPSLWRFAEAGK
jgi:hypothetical protein